jgi:phytoene dehydrogenase-like protein
VGSGFGGLAAAIRLQAAGVSTVLFEARDKPGGRAYVYEEQGYVFDAGPTVITALRRKRLAVAAKNPDGLLAGVVVTDRAVVAEER